MLRVVLDTNVFVSSLLVKAGVPAQVLDAWRAGRYELVISPPILLEIRAVLDYPRIRRKYAIGDEDVEQLLDLLAREAVYVSGDADISDAIPANASDEKILACAVDGRADLIVSGDLHLLDLGGYRQIPIVSVRELLTRLALEPSDRTTGGNDGIPQTGPHRPESIRAVPGHNAVGLDRDRGAGL